MLAGQDARLAPCLPRRRGVQLCEVAIDAAHKHSPRALGAAVARLLVRNPHRLEILRAAVHHFRMRRSPAERGAPLEDDAALRDWLATY